MRVKELVEIMSNNKNKLLKTGDAKEFIKNTIETKKYLPISEKRNLIENIIFESISYENGIYTFDDIKKYIYFTMKTIEAYTNLELSDNIEADYDVLCSEGLLNTVIETFIGEYENVNLLLQMKSNSILSNNGVEAQLGKFLSDVSENIDTISRVLTEKVSQFDMAKISLDNVDLGGLLKLINFQKK